MAECLRCGCFMKDDTANQRIQRGRDLWGCQECQAGKQEKVQTKYGLCQPHIGELDDQDRPLDKKGNLYRAGVRLCGYSDCVAIDHLILDPDAPIDSGIARHLAREKRNA